MEKVIPWCSIWRWFPGYGFVTADWYLMAVTWSVQFWVRMPLLTVEMDFDPSASCGCCWVRFQQCEETHSSLRATSARGKRSQASCTCMFQEWYRYGKCRRSGEMLSRLIYWSSRRVETPWSIIWLFLLSIQHAWVDRVSAAPQISLARGRRGVW